MTHPRPDATEALDTASARASGGSPSAPGTGPTPDDHDPLTLDPLALDPPSVDDQDSSSQTAGEPLRGPRLGVRGWVRYLWRQLTSMRTALVLLLLVALAAIPGSIFPQRTIDLTAVDTYLARHPAAGPVLDAMQMFDVYTSVWFSAVYILLVISLVGCILPRTAQYRRTLTAPPPAVPRRPERLGTSVVLETRASPADVQRHVQSALRRRRYRLRRDGEEAQPEDRREVAGETGYLREAGNILFHYGVVAVILALAAGYLVGWKGDRIVPIGESFANTSSAYHTFSGGPLVDVEAMQPFVVTLDSMTARFEDRVGTGQLGAPRDFRVATTIRDTPGSPPRHETLAVNHPLRFSGAEVYLLGNGYAPVVTVRDARGQVLYRQATPFLPGDANYRSTGAVKVPAASPTQLGFSGVFLPTAVRVDDTRTPDAAGSDLESGFPGLNDPMLVLSVYEGTLFPDAEPQSVYRLDTRGMKAVDGRAGTPLRLEMRPGEKVDLPAGRGSVEFSGIDRWAGISTRYDPVKGVALWSAMLMLAGLLASLVIPRRRVFLRATRARAVGGADAGATRAGATRVAGASVVTDSREEAGEPGGATGGTDPGSGATRVVLAGLARREDAGLAGLLDDLADDLVERLPGTTRLHGTDTRMDRP